MNVNIWKRQNQQHSPRRRADSDPRSFGGVKRFKGEENAEQTDVEKYYEAKLMAAQYKKPLDALLKDLKQLLRGKPEGIPIHQLQNSYSKEFHKNLDLKACGIKLTEIVLTFGDTLQEVKVNKVRCVRLRQDTRGTGSKADPGGAAALGRPSTSQGGPSAGSRSSQKQAKHHESGGSKKTAPAALTVPQSVFEPVPAHQKPGSSQPINPFEYQMDQYISGIRNSSGNDSRSRGGPPGMTGQGGNVSLPHAPFGGNVLGMAGSEFSFDQGSSFYQNFYDNKQVDENDSSQQRSGAKGSRKAQRKVPETAQSKDTQNWPSLAEAQTAPNAKSNTRFKSGNFQKPTGANQTADMPSSNKPVPLMSFSASSTHKSSTSTQSRPPGRDSTQGRPPGRDRTYYAKSTYPRSQIDDYAQNCIINLAEQNDEVTIERVMTLVKQKFQVERIEELGLRGDYQLDSIKQLQRLQTKINASIQAFVKVRAICTLHELHESLAALEGKNTFAEYNIGPLTKQRLIYDMFKFPTDKPDSEIPHITTMEVLEVLRQYLSEKNLWRARVKLEDFVEHVVKFYNVESPYVLGIRIQSVGLGISVIKTAQREQKQIMDVAREEVKSKVREECQTTMNKIRRAIMMHMPEITNASQFNPSTGPGLELRKTYVTMSAGQAINTVFENICELIGRNSKLDRFAFHLSGVIQDPLASAMFQLALCLGSLKPPEELLPDESDDSDDQDEDDDHHHQDRHVTSQESRGTQATDAEVLDELKRYLERLGMGVPKLRDLASIEKRLCQKFGSQNFSHLLATHRTFLEFMALDHPQVLEAFGGSLGVTSNNPMMGSPYRPSRMDIMEFIRQCDINKRSSEAITSALSSHYQVKSVEELGQGQLSMVMKHVQMQSKGSYDQDAHPITYEAALCAGIRSSDQKSQQVGLLGTQSLERALGCLKSAPLLEDLAEWTHWDLVFQPEHGDLKSFLETCPGAHLQVHIHALETKPGVLLKLTTHTNTDQFSAHAQNGDAINAAGHLVSLVVHDGIGNVPLALLGNHMEAALAKRLRTDMDAGRSNLEGGEMMRFAVEMLTRIPTQIAQTVAQQVILKPLSLVVGSENKSRELLLKACKTSTQRSRLQRLGLLLGISQWKAVIEERLPASVDNEDDMYEDDGEADIDVDSILLAAASTPNVKPKEMKAAQRNLPPDNRLQESIIEVPSTSADSEVITIDEDNTTGGDETIDLTEEKEVADDNTIEIEEGDTSQEDVVIDEDEDDRSDGDGAESEECNQNVEKSDATTRNNNAKTEVVIEEVIKEELMEASTDDTSEDANEGQKSAAEDGGDEEDQDVISMEDDEEAASASVEEIEEEEPEPELTEAQRHVWTCKKVIDSVRHDEFGVGMQLNEQTKQLMQRHQERIGRSLQRLSEELYSKDTHFVLELIQNADDNTYHVGTEPSLVFVVDTEAVTAMNNEKGFSEQDIRALCDVGKSTKGKHKHGYIGHKGIGFKSVFRVTDSPEIHSSGYHICFEHGKDPMGYILPTWIGPQDLNQLADSQTNADWATTIKLPLKGDLQRTSSLVNKFQDIQPSLLLFLHRLRSIVILNKGEGVTRQMKRQDVGDNVIEIKHNKVTESWLVVKQMLDATKLHRERVQSTELALAFPIKNGSSNIQNREQSVFAFLPLRSYGFHFIIQGDFDIPSSREDVDSDSAWNQWLQQNIAPLFVQALDTFKEYYEEDPIQAVCNFLQFVPLEAQILTEFFKKVAVSIHQRLKATPCLPIASGEEETQWRLPSETVMAKDPLIREVVQSSVLKTHLNCHYLHQKVVEECSMTLLSNLGVKKLMTSDLIGILKSVAIMAHTTGEHLPVEIVAKWLACIYRCRERDYDVSQDNLEQLRAIPIIPLTSGQRVTVKDTTVFFPISADDKVSPNDQRQFQTGSHVLKAVEADMAMVDVRLLHSLDDVANSQIRRMLEELGVRHISPQEVIHHHILPVLKSEERWKSKIRDNRDILIGYLVYIKEQYEKQPSVCNIQTDLRPYAQVITNHGPCNPATTPVHFPKIYGNAIDLPKELPGCDWVLLDSCYLVHRGTSIQQRDLINWQQFFTQLGVLCYLAVETKIVTLQESEMSLSPWADLYTFWPKPSNGVYKIKDQVCKEFEQLISYVNVSNPDVQKLQRHNLINHLHLRWQDSYAKSMTADLLDGETGNVIKQVESSFDIQLRSSPWLPCIAGGAMQFKSPVDIFLYSQKLFNLLGTHVPYLTLELAANSHFLQFLRVRNDSCLSPDFILAMLKTWCSYQKDERMTNTGHGSRFKAKLGHLTRVYQYLYQECRQKDLKELFDNYPAIFVPQDDTVKDWKTNIETPVQGQFVHKKCTYWQDPTGLLQKQLDKADGPDSISLRFAVREFYQDVENIFVTLKLIDQTPTLKEYVVLLVDMASEITLPDNEKLQDILKLYGMLGRICAERSSKEAGSDTADFRGGDTSTVDSNSNTCVFLRGLLQEEAIFPTRSNRWVTLADRPILCDDDSVEFEKLFTDDPRVHLLNMADKDRLGRTIREKAGSGRGRGVGGKENVKQFLEACQIQTLTECVEREFIPTLLQASPNVQLFMHTICPYIQRFISTHSQNDDNFQTLYQQLQEENMCATLKTMAFFEVDKLEVVHRMKHQADILNTSTMECGMVKSALYVVKKVVSQLHKNIQVRREISKMFSKGIGSCQKQLFSFLGSLLLSLEPSHLGKGISDDLCSQLELEPLEEGMEEWQVPKPIMPEIIRKPPPPPPAPVRVERPPAEGTRPADAKDGEAGLEGDSGLIRSWPPKSSAYGPTPSKGPKSQDDDAGMKMWPPPAPPTTPSPLQPAPLSPGSAEGTSHTTIAGDQQREGSVAGEGGQGSVKRSELVESGSTDGKGFLRQVSTASDGSTAGHKRSDGEHTGHGGEHTGHGGEGTGHRGEGHKTPGAHPQTLGDFVKAEAHSQQSGNLDVSGEDVELVEDDEMEESDREEVEIVEGDTEVMEVEANIDISRAETEDNMSFHTPPTVRYTPGPYAGTPGSASGRRLRQMAPMWSVVPTVEVEFENIARGAEINEYMGVLEISPDWDEAERNLQTGRWGEALVYNYLQQQAERSGGGVRITWVNEHEETGQPFDVVMEREDATIYIEVKATKFDQKELFEISSKEVAFAEQQKECFHLYRVYNAGSSENARLCRLQNLAFKMEKKEVRLCMYI